MSSITNTITISRKIMSDLRYDLDEEIFILYVVAFAYYNGIISEEKYKGQIKSLREGNLQKFKQTYHCTINDHWYNDESAREVFDDVLTDIALSGRNHISLEALLSSIMLFNGMNYNYAINVFYERILRVMIKRWAHNVWGKNDFIAYNDLNIDYLMINHSTRPGYCCWECGNSTADENDPDASINEAEERMLEFLHTQKRGNLKKIPKYSNDMLNWLGMK